MSDAFQLRHAVETQARGWREYHKVLETFTKLLDQYEKEYKRATGSTFNSGRDLFHAARDERRMWRRYLRARFGVSMFGVPTGEGFWRREYRVMRRRYHPPESYQEYCQLFFAIHQSIWWDITWCEANRIIYQSVAARRDPWPAVKAALLRRFANYAASAGAGMTSFPHPAQRTAATLSLAGWVRTHISLHRNIRLRESLGADGSNPNHALLEQLPAAVRVTWDECGSAAQLKALVNAAEKELARDQEPRYKRAGRVDDIQAGLPDIAAADVQLREEATARARLDALAAKVKLTPREKQVWAAKQAGYLVRPDGYTNREIAAQLNMTENSVKVHWFNIRAKCNKIAS